MNFFIGGVAPTGSVIYLIVNPFTEFTAVAGSNLQA